MRIVPFLALALFVLASCSDDKSINPTPPPSAAAKMGADVSFADRNLELLVRWALKKPEGRITSDELAALNHLDARNRLNAEQQPIRNLAGIQHCTGLDTLLLWGHQITDISPLAGLTELRSLDLAGNQVSDASPLAELTELRHLSLWGNQVTDLRPLASLTKLEKLSLFGNGITDVKPLAGLTKLKQLQLGNNEIEDVRPLNGLDQLDWLGLVGNPISSSALRQQIPALMKNVSITLKTPGPSFPVTAKDDEPEPAEPPVDPSVRPYNLYVGDPWVLQYEDPPEGLSVRSLPSWLSFDAATGRIEGTPTQAGTYEFVVDYGDGDEPAQRILLIVADERPDRFTDTLILGQGYGFALYEPESGVSFTIEGDLPPGFSYNRDDPELAQLDGVPEATGTFDFDYVVRDASGEVVYREERRFVVITDPSSTQPEPEPELTFGEVPFLGSYVEDFPIAPVEFPDASGGVPPYTYSMSGVPPGLTFDPATRTLSGTPTAAGTYTIVYLVEEASGRGRARSIPVVVESEMIFGRGVPFLGSYVEDFPIAPVEFPDASGGVPPYTYSMSGVPPGLTFDPATRTLSGTPTAAGTYTIVYRITGASGNSIATSIPTVVEPAIELTFEHTGIFSPIVFQYTEGSPIAPEEFPGGSGGVPPYTYSMSGVPPGLTFDPATRILSGMPTAVGTYTMVYYVTDASGSSRAGEPMTVYVVYRLPSE